MNRYSFISEESPIRTFRKASLVKKGQLIKKSLRKQGHEELAEFIEKCEQGTVASVSLPADGEGITGKRSLDIIFESYLRECGIHIDRTGL